MVNISLFFFFFSLGSQPPGYEAITLKVILILMQCSICTFPYNVWIWKKKLLLYQLRHILYFLIPSDHVRLTHSLWVVLILAFVLLLKNFPCASYFRSKSLNSKSFRQLQAILAPKKHCDKKLHLIGWWMQLEISLSIPSLIWIHLANSDKEGVWPSLNFFLSADCDYKFRSQSLGELENNTGYHMFLQTTLFLIYQTLK